MVGKVPKTREKVVVEGIENPRVVKSRTTATKVGLDVKQSELVPSVWLTLNAVRFGGVVASQCTNTQGLHSRARELPTNLKDRHLRCDPFDCVKTSAFREDSSDYVLENNASDGHGPFIQRDVHVKMLDLRCRDTNLSDTSQPREAYETVFQTHPFRADEGLDTGRPRVVLAIRSVRKTVMEDAHLVVENFICSSEVCGR